MAGLGSLYELAPGREEAGPRPRWGAWVDVREGDVCIVCMRRCIAVAFFVLLNSAGYAPSRRVSLMLLP